MIRAVISFSNQKEKSDIISHLEKLQGYNIKKVSREYQSKGKGLLRVYVDLSSK